MVQAHIRRERRAARRFAQAGERRLRTLRERRHHADGKSWRILLCASARGRFPQTRRARTTSIRLHHRAGKRASCRSVRRCIKRECVMQMTITTAACSKRTWRGRSGQRRRRRHRRWRRRHSACRRRNRRWRHGRSSSMGQGRRSRLGEPRLRECGWEREKRRHALALARTEVGTTRLPGERAEICH